MIPVIPVKKDGKFYFLNCGDEGTMEVSEVTYNAMVDSIREYNMKAQMAQQKRQYDRKQFVDKLSERLREVREAAGLTQQQLSQKIGVSANCISQYETGKRIPNLHAISIISHELNVSLDDLVPYVPCKKKHDLSQMTIFDVLF